MDRMLIEGGPAPQLGSDSPIVHFEYIDDFGLIVFLQDGDSGLIEGLSSAVKTTLHDLIHKEELGAEMLSLGRKVGGSPRGVVGGPVKQWLAIECTWALSQVDRAMPSQVESVTSLATWLFMVRRGGLSILQDTYTWTRKYRTSKVPMTMPITVRREMAAVSAVLPLVEQRWDAPWMRTVFMFDASEIGGGVS